MIAVLKRKIKNEYILLFLLFLFVLSFRLYFAFQTGHFNTDDSYFHLRHIESIVHEKSILVYDDLSYGGRLVLYPPLFHILMALLTFGSMFMLKLIPEILISCTVFVVYIIAKNMSGNSYAALFSALLSSFYPILFFETLNNISVYSLVIPVLFLMLYSLLNLENKFYLWFFIISSFMLPLLHSSALVFVVVIFIYFLLLTGGALTATKLKKEAVVFSILLMILLQFIIYKKAFLDYGMSVLWQNIPSNILSDSFRKLVPIDLLIGIGLLPLIFGSFGVYLSVFREKRKIDFMFVAFSISILLLIVFRFLTISLGLMFLGLALSIFSSVSLSKVYSYLANLKFKHIRNLFTILLLIAFAFSSFMPSLSAAKDSNEIANSKFKEVSWISINTKDVDTVVLGNLGEGNLIAAIGNRRNVVVSDFVLAPNPVGRAKDVEVVYTTVSEAIATSLLRKYDVKLIYLSDDTKDTYKIDSLKYAKRSKCFDSLRGGRYYVFKC